MTEPIDPVGSDKYGKSEEGVTLNCWVNITRAAEDEVLHIFTFPTLAMAEAEATKCRDIKDPVVTLHPSALAKLLRDTYDL